MTARHFTAFERGPALVALWLLCTPAGLACDAFGDPPSEDPVGASSPPTVPGVSNSTPFEPVRPSVMPPTTPQAEPPPPPKGFPMMCKPCGVACDDCGSGCRCAPGGRPDVPEPWRSPFVESGEDGWKDSTEPFCAGLGQTYGTDVWRDARGVYVLVHGLDEMHISLDLPDDDAGVINTTSRQVPEITRVLHNDGHGWSLRADLAGMALAQRISAVGTSLVLYGAAWQGRTGCTLGMITGDRFSCEDLGQIEQVYPVDDITAFALGNGQVFGYDGSAWNPQPGVLVDTAYALWSDGRELVVVGSRGVVARKPVGGDTWSPASAGNGNALTALWGTSTSDLWAGDEHGRLLHFDGDRWSEIADLGATASCTSRPPILGLWGAGEHVWAYTASQLVRWNGSALETFGNWTCSGEVSEGEHISGLAGSAENDVFIAITNTVQQSACGGSFLLHYDGESFHRF